jgi:hypothetical protein
MSRGKKERAGSRLEVAISPVLLKMAETTRTNASI